jgi:hypothetical protein
MKLPVLIEVPCDTRQPLPMNTCTFNGTLASALVPPASENLATPCHQIVGQHMPAVC